MTRSSRWMSAGVSVGDNDAMVEHGDAVGNAENKIHVMLDQQHGHAPAQAADDPASAAISSATRPAAGSSSSRSAAAPPARGRSRPGDDAHKRAPFAAGPRDRGREAR